MHRFIKIRIIRDFECLEERVRRWRDTPVELGESGVSFRPATDFYETSQDLKIHPVERLDQALEIAFPGAGR